MGLIINVFAVLEDFLFVSFLQMLAWMQENRAEYLLNYTDIGEDLESVEEIREEHKQFETNCVVSFPFIIDLPQLNPISISLTNFLTT